SVREAGLTT
nr:immunoglobulin heavy chain junction region [Mus musculus]